MRLSILATLILSFIPYAADATVIRTGGTGAALAILERLGEKFTETHTDATVEVLPSLGSSGGIEALRAGAIDFAITARPLKESERDTGLRESPWVVSPLAFVTSETTPPTRSPDELASMFGDPKAAWPGGTPVRIILRPKGESAYKVLGQTMPAVAAAIEAARERPELPLAMTDQDNLKLTQRLAGSLSVAPLVQVLSEQSWVRLVPLDGVVPSASALIAGRYPLEIDFWLVSKPANQNADLFLAFLLSEAARELLTAHGAVARQ